MCPNRNRSNMYQGLSGNRIVRSVECITLCLGQSHCIQVSTRKDERYTLQLQDVPHNVPHHHILNIRARILYASAIPESHTPSRLSVNTILSKHPKQPTDLSRIVSWSTQSSTFKILLPVPSNSKGFLTAFSLLHHQKCLNLVRPRPALTDKHLHLPQMTRTNLPGGSDLPRSRSDFCDQALVMTSPLLGQPLQERPRKVTLVMQGGHCLWWYVWVDFVAIGQAVIEC
ncbi:uncharacterized protein EV420DRAFT_1170303 [Desarmillaria tabescens]|uniref:Uncharacterized protein n=1 Tax=Armillaria tabescens TaxID=1929756 RepID=A0AA39JF80_ARMTA|nr:uncharacterized protein EV420DRAFT_1170303 [Desarmillaria tabescens]KAK0439483.1 hypothetical protein EV420DRAFT_1170303 [Desarmillaria tabescens]